MRTFAATLGTREPGITLSIGVVTILDPSVSPERVVATADELMYEVKHRGKDSVAYSIIGGAVPGRAAADLPVASPGP